MAKWNKVRKRGYARSKGSSLPESERYHIRLRLRLLGYPSLAAYYRSPLWRATRKKYRKKACETNAKSHSGSLQLHHKTYERLGNELPGDFMTLCNACHRLIHGHPAPRRARKKKR